MVPTALVVAMPFLFASAVASRPSADRIARRHPERPVVIAHRGASALAPENTLAAYRKAIELGAVAAETDVHLSADGKVWVIHDPTLDRTTDGAGWVSATQSAQIRELDAGSWFEPPFPDERVPELGELLDLVRNRTVLCIEIKDGLGIEFVIRDEVDARKMRGQIIVFSFKPNKMALAKALMPEVPALLLVHRDADSGAYPPKIVDDARAIHADALGLNHEAVDTQIVERAHDAGLPLFVYTVDAPEDIRRMVDLGVDGIISNDPEAAETIVRELRPAR